MSKRESQDFGEANNLGRMSPKGYREPGVALDSLASMKQNIRLFCNGTTDERK